MTLQERFLKRLVVGDENDCWPWPGEIDTQGYGKISVGPRGAQAKLRAHRVSYQVLVGPIPDGLLIGHTCDNPPCVNPLHLEPVTTALNTLRGNSLSAQHARRETCLYGHAYTPENLRITPQGWRDCRICARTRNRRAKQAQYARLIAKRGGGAKLDLEVAS